MLFSFKLIIFFIIIIILLCFIISLIRLVNINNTKLLKDFENTYKQLGDYKIYKKIRFIKPQQISVEGSISITHLTEKIQELQTEYNELLRTNENEILQEKINTLEAQNREMEEKIETLQQLIIILNKKIQDLADENK